MWSKIRVLENDKKSKFGSINSSSVNIEEDSAVISIVKKNSPAVVSIISKTRGFSWFSGDYEASGAGTGMIVTSSGLILTNRHVVEGGASFKVILGDGASISNREYDARLVTVDSFNDIAFLKIEGADFPVVELGNSSSIEVGQRVIAIGNALGQFQNSATTGVISGKSRKIQAESDNSNGYETLENLLQTDAAINPGNSGGPLMNIAGQVIGINTAKAGGTSQNIGFAIPIDDVKNIIDSVSRTGKIERTYLGVKYFPITQEYAAANNLPKNEGVLIKSNNNESAVIKNSPADRAGVKEGDIILSIDDKVINADYSLSSIISKYQPGQKIKLKVFREGQEIELNAVLEKADN